jgi:hypothetical protein
VQPTRVLPAVSVLSLVSVGHGGWALLGFLTGRGQLGEPNRRSLGTVVTRFGAPLIAAALLIVAFGLFTSGRGG